MTRWSSCDVLPMIMTRRRGRPRRDLRRRRRGQGGMESGPRADLGDGLLPVDRHQVEAGDSRDLPHPFDHLDADTDPFVLETGAMNDGLLHASTVRLLTSHT